MRVDNRPAVALYEKLGFTPASLPTLEAKLSEAASPGDLAPLQVLCRELP